MKRVAALLALTLCCSWPVFSESAMDKCHVYLVDQSDQAAEEIQKLLGEVTDPEELEKRFADFVKILGEFTTDIGEERQTTKSYPLPGDNQFVTVTVFYTDESMAAENAGDVSMLLSITVADKKLESAQGATDCAQAEISWAHFVGKVRVKKVILLNGKERLIGLECECKKDDSPKQ